MSRICEMTGVGPFTGNVVSHSNRKARTRWLPNLKKKKYMIPELSQTLTLTLSTRAIRTIDKHGNISSALLNVKEDGLSPRLRKVRSQVIRARQTTKPGTQPAAKTTA